MMFKTCCPAKSRRLHSPVYETLEARHMLTASVVGPTPFLGKPVPAGQFIEAENFDTGGEGVAYHNPGQQNPLDIKYRSNTTIGLAPGGSNGYVVGFTRVGEWLDYTISVPADGNYVLTTRAACPYSGKQIHAVFDGAISTGPVTLSRTPNWSSYHTVISNAVGLTAGVHVMRICIDPSSNSALSCGNFDYFGLIPTTGPDSFNWKPAPDSTLKQFEGEGRFVNGKLYTFGGYTAVSPFGANQTYQVYDPVTQTWTNLGQMPVPQTHAGVAVDDATGTIYFVGGLRGFYPGTATTDVWAYHTADNTWSRLPSLPKPLSAGNAQIVDGQLHYIGGNIGQARDVDVTLHLVLNLNALASGTATWTAAAPLPSVRDHFSDAVVDGKIYVIGGEVGHDTYHLQQTAGNVYDPASDSWSAIAPLPIPRSHAESSTFVVGGKIIVAGGQVDDFKATSTILEYDPAANQWSLLPPLPIALEGTILQANGDELVLTGGYDGLTGVATNHTYTAIFSR